MENDEYRSRVRQLERGFAEQLGSTQEGVGQLRNALEMVKVQLEEKEEENKFLHEQIHSYEGNSIFFLLGLILITPPPPVRGKSAPDWLKVTCSTLFNSNNG